MNKNEKEISEEELQSAIKGAGSILKDRDREEFFIFLKGSTDQETGDIQGSSSFYSLKEVLAEYYSLKRKERRQYGIWDVARGFPIDIPLARETGIRSPDCRYDPETGEVLGYRM